MDGKLDKSGGTLTGSLTLTGALTLTEALTLSGNATSELGAVPKRQVETLINTAVAGFTSAYIGGRGQVFTGPGTFTVPAGVTSVKVRGGGGGGCGGGYNNNGGTTSFGSYCSATGGINGNFGGAGGTAAGGDLNSDGSARTPSSGGLCGGTGFFGDWHGNGGHGGAKSGGGGGYFERYITGLTPGSAITVTVGAGGWASTIEAHGKDGLVIVEW